MAVTVVTSKNFDTEVLQASASQTVLIDFWAGWCNPCRMLSPIVDEIAEEQPSIKVCKINIDEQPKLAEKYEVMSIPTLLTFKNGKVLNQSVGVQPKEAILNLLK
jgi:thioredoxin 1